MKYTDQRCKRCTFDSPGLSNDSADYPGGSICCAWNNAISVVPFRRNPTFIHAYIVVYHAII